MATIRCRFTAEAYRKRQYPNMFISKLADADAEATETQVWLDFSRDCGYLSPERHTELSQSYIEVGKMFGAMMANPQRFAPAKKQVGIKH